MIATLTTETAAIGSRIEKLRREEGAVAIKEAAELAAKRVVLRSELGQHKDANTVRRVELHAFRLVEATPAADAAGAAETRFVLAASPDAVPDAKT